MRCAPFMLSLGFSLLVATQGASQSDSEPRRLLIRVMDDAGHPVSQVSVHVTGIGDKRNLPRKNYLTDDNGEAAITVARDARILQLWPSKSGYVPQSVAFDDSKSDQGRAIPNEYVFHFQRGTPLSGRVVDDRGKSLAGAKVEVKVSGNVELSGQSKRAVPQPGINVWLASGSGAAVTDEDGRWTVNNAPPQTSDSRFTFELMVDHPDFAGDSYWGESQKKQGITDEQLRDGSATMTLRRGNTIAGTITGPEGELVTEGLVIWDDRPYWATGVNETQIENTGRYQTPRLGPGDYPVTVVAPGYAPTQRTVSVSQGLPEVDFQLEAGNAIKLEIVDALGKPIPDAQVSIGQWRGTEAIYNHKHSGVLPSGIPRHADRHGMYVWTWAPSDGVEYQISAKGYDLKSVTLVAKDESHRVVLDVPMSIFGRIVDAESDQPIRNFRAIPVKEFRSDFYSTDFQEGRVAEGKDGQYKITINSYGDSDDRHRVRIEAEGYRTAFGTKSLAPGDPPLEENFRLEPAPPLVGNVVDANGNPVKTFEVAIGTPTTAPHFSIDRIETSFGQGFTIEGTNQFELAATFEPQRIRVLDDAGFAEVLRMPDEPIGTITLEPWASISGRLTQDGQPIGNQWIYFRLLETHDLTDARFQDSFAVKTDPQGNYHFDRLPPMAGFVSAQLGPWRDSVLTSSLSVPVNLKPGDRKEIVLGPPGVTVVGRVVATGRSNDELSKQWSLNYLISRDRALPDVRDTEPPRFDDSGTFDSSWLKHPGFQSWLPSRENHFVKLAADGRLWIHSVRPGAYDLVFQIYEQPAGCLVETIGEKVVPVEVTEEQVGTGAFDLGDIEIKCRQGPRAGSSMKAFQFTDRNGRVRFVDQMSGRYVLFHVWASWCQPCLASMPELKHAAETYFDDPVTFVGLNIDGDDAAAKRLAEDGRWDWAHNYLGDESDMMRQLAISTVPAYYLVGPDGKLVGSANEWKQIEQMLEDELR